MKVKSYAKINLYMEVLRKREDGYHDIDTLMQTIDLYDILDIRLNDKNEIRISSSDKSLDLGPSNLVYKAWQALLPYRKGDVGVDIHIEKKIPIAAGLAGGTSNGAQVFLALNKLWGLELSLKELQEIALKKGADFPFCLIGGTMRARGIGEILSPLKSLSGVPVLLVNPGLGLSTKLVYDKINTSSYEKGPCDEICQKINDGDETYKGLLFNRLQEISESLVPESKKIREELLNMGAEVALVSGSGPTVFSFFNEDKIDRAYDMAKKKWEKVYKTETIF